MIAIINTNMNKIGLLLLTIFLVGSYAIEGQFRFVQCKNPDGVVSATCTCKDGTLAYSIMGQLYCMVASTQPSPLSPQITTSNIITTSPTITPAVSPSIVVASPATSTFANLQSLKTQDSGNCLVGNTVGTCSKCKENFYLTETGSCIRKSLLCQEYAKDGKCKQCVIDYIPVDGLCKPVVSSVRRQDLACLKFDDKDASRCIKCIYRYYSDASGVCKQVSQQCKTYDQIDGKCLSCYFGY